MKKPFDLLIFDLGNVIIDIDYQPTIDALQQYSSLDVKQLLSYHKQAEVFDDFERGSITKAAFIAAVRSMLQNAAVPDEVIVHAWEQMLRHYPPAKIELLLSLKERYRVVALSNINEIHIAAIDEAARNLFGVSGFHSFFHQTYYSNQMGCRKPEDAIYRAVVATEQIPSVRPLFIDDKQENIEAAIRNGIHALRLLHRDELFDLLQQQQVI